MGDIDDARFGDVPTDVVRGVEIGLAAPNCQPFSLANPNARGLDDVRAWHLVDTPLTFAKFPNLLRTSVENVLGCRQGIALAYYRCLMSQINNYVCEPEVLFVPEGIHLNMCVLW